MMEKTEREKQQKKKLVTFVVPLEMAEAMKARTTVNWSAVCRNAVAAELEKRSNGD